MVERVGVVGVVVKVMVMVATDMRICIYSTITIVSIVFIVFVVVVISVIVACFPSKTRTSSDVIAK